MPGTRPLLTALSAPGKQPVTNPGNLPPAREPSDKPPKLPRRNRGPTSPRRKRQHHFRRVIHTPNERIPGNNHPHRPASTRAHPPKRDSTSVPPGNPGVISSHKRGKALRPPRIGDAPRRAAIGTRVLAAGDLTNDVRRQPPKSNLKAVKTKPAASHHETSPQCRARGCYPPSTIGYVRQRRLAQEPVTAAGEPISARPQRGMRGALRSRTQLPWKFCIERKENTSCACLISTGCRVSTLIADEGWAASTIRRAVIWGTTGRRREWRRCGGSELISSPGAGRRPAPGDARAGCGRALLTTRWAARMSRAAGARPARSWR